MFSTDQVKIWAFGRELQLTLRYLPKDVSVVLRETTLTISDFIETYLPVETKIVSGFPLLFISPVPNWALKWFALGHLHMKNT